MPAIVIPPGFAQVVLRWQQAGRPNEYLSTFGCEVASGTTDPSAVAQDAVTTWNAQWAAADYPTDYVFLGATAYLGQDGGPPLSGEFLTNRTGTSASARPTPNCCLLVKKRSAQGGKRNRGRMYLPAGVMTEADIGSDGRIATTPFGTFQSKMNAFLTALVGTTNIDRMVIFHSTTPFTPTVVTQLQVDSIIATQRERMRR